MQHRHPEAAPDTEWRRSDDQQPTPRPTEGPSEPSLRPLKHPSQLSSEPLARAEFQQLHQEFSQQRQMMQEHLSAVKALESSVQHLTPAHLRGNRPLQLSQGDCQADSRWVQRSSVHALNKGYRKEHAPVANGQRPAGCGIEDRRNSEPGQGQVQVTRSRKQPRQQRRERSDDRGNKEVRDMGARRKRSESFAPLQRGCRQGIA